MTAERRAAKGAKRLRPSEVFARRLSETRKARGLTQTDLAQLMTTEGYPMTKPAVLRIEKGSRGLLLDEALTIAAVLRAVPAHLLSPPEGELIRLTNDIDVDGAGLRDFFRFGLPFTFPPEWTRARSSARFEVEMFKHAQALVDAKRGNDRAGMAEARDALVMTAARHAGLVEQKDGESDAS